MQCWIIVLHDWVAFRLQPRSTHCKVIYGDPFVDSEGLVYETAGVASGAEAVLEETYLGKYEVCYGHGLLLCGPKIW